MFHVRQPVADPQRHPPVTAPPEPDDTADLPGVPVAVQGAHFRADAGELQLLSERVLNMGWGLVIERGAGLASQPLFGWG